MVTLTQFSQIDHPIASDPSASGAPFVDQILGLADNLISLTGTVSATDKDGDTAGDSATIAIGANLQFADDGPTLGAVRAGAGVTIDETAAGSPAGFPLSATSDAPVINASAFGYGADGPAASGALSYGLQMVSANSGLKTANGDFAITLVQTSASVISGSYVEGGVTKIAFSVTINSNGSITVVENVALEHNVDGSTAAAHNDSLDLSGLINATITANDYDGDTATAAVAIGDKILFLDDGPSITVRASSDAEILLRTDDADTAGALSDTASSSANFGGVFQIAANGGADGVGSQLLAFTLAVTNTASGLQAHGVAINLYTVGNVVIGSTAASAAGISAENTVFNVTVDANGVVTLTQFSQIDHALASDPTASGAPFNDQLASLADGLVTLTATGTVIDTDGDSASATQTVSIGANLQFSDHGPSVSGAAAGAGVIIDETAAGSPQGFPLTATSASAVITTGSALYGADGPGSAAYALGIVGDGASGIKTAIGDFAITLVQTDANVVIGTYVEGGVTKTAFSVTINANGTLSVIESVALEHNVDGGTQAAYNDALSLAGLLNASITLTDFDGDTATGTVAIGDKVVFLDDGPSILVSAGSDASVVLRTDDADTLGALIDSATSTADFGGVFSSTSSGGADGTASANFVYSLAITAGLSGLTSGGLPIYLRMSGSVVVGTTAEAGPITAANLVFSVLVNSATGVVTLNQSNPIDHPIASDPSATGTPFNDQLISLADNLVRLTATGTIVDNDGDSATSSETVNIGSNIQFSDDGPTIVELAAGSALSIDETSAGTVAGFPITVKGPGGSALSGSVLHGADGEGSPDVLLGLEVASASTNLKTAIGDFAITLVQTSADTVTGTYVEGGITKVAFSVTINQDNSLTVTENVPLEHNVDGSTPAAYNDALNLAGLINATVTATDFDGDTAKSSTPIGQNVIFLDDGPSITISAGADASVSLITDDAGTPGALSDTASSTANFSGVFATLSAGGADGASGVTNSYALNVTNIVSGLSAHGAAINLYLVTGTVVGSTAASAAGVNAGNTVFNVSVNASTGVVTLTQFSQFDHPLATSSNFPADVVSLVDGLITLTATGTITDNDGDTATSSATIGIGANLHFTDDGPSLSNVVAASGVSVDETNAVGPGFPISNVSAAALITASAAYGADGAGSAAYGLTVVGGGVTALKTALGDFAITLVQTSPSTITGTYVEGGVTKTAFTAVIGSDGKVTLTQNIALEHNVDGNTAAAYNDALSLAGLVNASITLTDFDGDKVTQSVAVGNLISFLDDGPSAVADSANVTEGGSVSGNVLTNDAPGADGYAVGGGVTGVQAGNSTSDIVGGVGVAIAGSFGTLTLNANGTYTYVSTANAITANATNTFSYTIKDSDGDFQTVTLVINLADVTIVGPSANVTVNEAALDLVQDAGDLAAGTVVGSNPSSSAESVSGTIGQPGVTITAQSSEDALGKFVLNANGTFTYTLKSAFDGATTNNGVTTQAGVRTFNYVGTDANGNSVTGTITVNIVDDVPTARNDTDTVDANATATGNVITGASTSSAPGGIDTKGADGAAVSTVVGFAGSTDSAFDGNGNLQVNGQYGTLLIAADGSYTYTRTPGSPGGVSDSFTYTLTDGDGDTSSATLVIAVPDARPVAGTASASVDDDGLVGGNAVSTAGDLNANLGETPSVNPSEAIFNGQLAATAGDGASSFLFASTLAGTNVAVGTEAATYAVSADGLTLTATGPRGLLFTVQITDAATGTYTVTLNDNVLHASLDGAVGDNTENDATVAVPFQVKDADGDLSTLPGTLTITFDDDAPSAFTPTSVAAANGDSAPVTAPLNLNIGADGFGTLQFDIINGQVAQDSFGNALTLNGQALYLFGDNTGTIVATTNATGTGTLGYTVTLNAATGNYTFDVAGTISNGTETSFTDLVSSAAGNVDYRGIGVGAATGATDVLGESAEAVRSGGASGQAAANDADAWHGGQFAGASAMPMLHADVIHMDAVQPIANG